MRHMWTALPREIQQWLRLKSIHEQSDFDAFKPIMLSYMQYRRCRDTRSISQRRQRPGESYAQFVLALQSIFDTCFGNRVPPDVQEELICANFIPGAYPPTLQGKRKSLGRSGIAELIKAATASAQTTPLSDQPHSTPRREKPTPQPPCPETHGQNARYRVSPEITLFIRYVQERVR